MIVGVDDVAALVEVARKMELAHAGPRHGTKEGHGVELVVEGADIDVVDVEQDLAIGAPRELGDELPLGELGGGVGDVARHVLQHQAAAEMVLHAPHALGDVVERFLGVRQRQQVVHVEATQAREAQMVGNPHRLHAIDEGGEVVEIAPVQRIDRADGQRHTVQRHRIVAADAVEPVQRGATRHHVVFREHFEPAHPTGIGGNFIVVLGPKPQSKIDARAHSHGDFPQGNAGVRGMRGRPRGCLACRLTSPCRRQWCKPRRP